MRGIEQLGSSFGPAVLFPNENSRGGGHHAHSSWGKSLVLGPR